MSLRSMDVRRTLALTSPYGGGYNRSIKKVILYYKDYNVHKDYRKGKTHEDGIV